MHVEGAAAIEVPKGPIVASVARLTVGRALITVRELVSAIYAVPDSVVVGWNHAVSAFNTLYILPLIVRQNRIVADLDL